ncbi:hypothetical protein KORDIASMS9_00086 [Kordia sp. SMS9]|uniref:hypothetical protein n=1 Tax=Kordia sp. SMS9 TaxID=2282170 RepID=UPI000E10D4D1|nr:hypothetical protein [Kordia sp. SMS9]AXG67904.1 hypothetical protein KORDIASMS9_00086 [Kordia sp. SMS9]
MKHIFKIIYSTVIIAIVMSSCASDSETSRFQDNPETGWVEFRAAATTSGQTVTNLQIPVSIEVPVYPEGFSISYSFEAVQGDFTQFVLNTTPAPLFIDPLETTRSPNISIDLINMNIGRDFVTSFDIVMTAVDKTGITLGNGEESILRHTVTIPCSNPPITPNNYYVGDYTIADVSATIGPGNGTENFAGGTVTLAVDPTNPNRRIFTVGALPAFNGQLEQVVIEFTTDNVAILAEVVDPSLACSAAGPYIFTTDAAGVPWDICSDQTITIPYTEDPNSSCGGPFPASFSLTKN